MLPMMLGTPSLSLSNRVELAKPRLLREFIKGMVSKEFSVGVLIPYFAFFLVKDAFGLASMPRFSLMMLCLLLSRMLLA